LLSLTAEIGLTHFTHCRRIQSLSYGYTTSTRQCHMHPICTLHCASCPIPLLPPKKRYAPFLTGDIHAQSSNWNNGKMKIAYNSAYVQTETFNSTFAQQAIIMYVCLSLFQLPINCYAERLIIRYKPIIFLPIMLDCTLIASKKSTDYGC